MKKIKMYYQHLLMIFSIIVTVSCVCAVKQASAQAEPAATAIDEIKPLKIGDKVPDELWALPLQMVNHPKGKDIVALKEYRGKLIIIDFWATWCSACLKSFPKLNGIKEEFGDQLEILLVNIDSKKSKEEIDLFLKNYSETYNTPFIASSIVNDSILRKLIPFKLIPNYLWIGKEGIIEAVTSSEGVERKDIASLLKGEEVLINTKSDRMDFDFKKPFLFDREMIENGQLQLGSAFSGPIKGLPTMASGSVNVTNPITRVFAINTNILFLLRLAYELNGSFSENRIILEVKEPTRYRYTEESGESMMDWRGRNTYCYELYSSENTKGKILAKMRSDLLEHFGISASLENRNLDCWVLTSDGEHSNRTIHKEKNIDRAQLQRSVKDFADYLNYMLPVPVINESNYMGDEAIAIPSDLSDLNKLIADLKSKGLQLKMEKRDMPVFVVKDTDTK